MIKAANVKAGDRLDLEGDRYADPNGDGIGESGHFYGFEFELAEVESVEVETPGCIVIHTQLGSFGFPADHAIREEDDREISVSREDLAYLLTTARKIDELHDAGEFDGCNNVIASALVDLDTALSRFAYGKV